MGEGGQVVALGVVIGESRSLLTTTCADRGKTDDADNPGEPGEVTERN